MELTQRKRKSQAAVSIGLLANMLLAAAKTGVGVIGHSPALLADGINSTADVAYYVVVGAFMRVAGKPPDDEHPYGHYQLESVGALVVGAFVISTAIAIFWNSVNVLYDLAIGESDFTGAESVALWVALGTILIKNILYIYTNRLGKQTTNPAVIALGQDHRNDIFSASAAAVGILMGQLGFYWVDPLAGALVSFVILYTGIEILRESTLDLMATVPSQPINKQIKSLLANIPKIEQIDEIKVHRFGPYLVINITICVDGSMSVVEGDKVATQVEDVIMRDMDLVRQVHVHYHPYGAHG